MAPAQSVSQRRFMAMVEHDPTASPEVEKAAESMTKEQAHDFAATKEKGLPMHKKHHKPHHADHGRKANPRGAS